MPISSNGRDVLHASRREFLQSELVNFAGTATSGIIKDELAAEISVMAARRLPAECSRTVGARAPLYGFPSDRHAR